MYNGHMNETTATQTFHQLLSIIYYNAYDNFKFSGTIGDFISEFHDAIYFTDAQRSQIDALRPLSDRHITLRAYYSKSENDHITLAYVSA